MITGRRVLAAKIKERDEQKAIESRMTVIQQTFDDATTMQGTVFSVDEGLLDEVETMFEFLRKEIVILRKKNTKLKKELAEAESDKREIFNHASSVDHAFALSKIRNEQMSKTNMSLLDDNNRRRKEATKLKNELKTQQQAHESQLQDMRSEFEMALRHRETQVTNVSHDLRSSTVLHKREIEQIRQEASRQKDEHFSQISRLRDEIKNTQNSHDDYLSKLMNVLETTQESRNSMIAAPSSDRILEMKDDEIADLRDEITRLRQSSGEGAEDTNGHINNDADRKEATKAMKYIVKKNREQRKARVHELGELTNRLEESLALGDLSQMQQLIVSMKSAIQTNEKSNSKMDREVVTMIDNTAIYSRGGDGSDIQQEVMLENQKLRRKLKQLSKQACKQCGYKREKKRGDEVDVLEKVKEDEMEM